MSNYLLIYLGHYPGHLIREVIKKLIKGEDSYVTLRRISVFAFTSGATLKEVEQRLQSYGLEALVFRVTKESFKISALPNLEEILTETFTNN